MRARNIKPGYFKNEDLLDCEPLARILFSGLWCMADREGRLEDRPKKIKIEILPCDNCDTDALLQQLHDHGLIIRYEVAGERYIEIPTFSEHQRPHNNEIKSIIPPRTAAVTEKEIAISSKVESTSNQGEKHSALNPESLTTDSLNPECSSTEETRTRKKSKITLDDLSVDHNAEWLAMKRCEGRYLLHDEHFVLEQFKQYCRSKGKKYADYLEAYRNAFEWERCQPKAGASVGGNSPIVPKSAWTSAAEQIIAADRAAAAAKRERSG